MNIKLFKWQKLVLSLIASFLFSPVFGQLSLYGIESTTGNTAYELVEYDIVTGTGTTVLNFDPTLGEIRALTYDKNNNVFYAYAHAEAINISELIEINSCDSTVTSLGQIMMTNPAPGGIDSVFKSEGLAYDPILNELYGTVGIIQAPAGNNWLSVNLVEFTIGTANCTFLNTINQGATILHNEMDAMVFTDNSILEGMDATNYNPGSFSNTYTVDYTTNPGVSVFIDSYNNGIDIKGMAYNPATDLIYTAYQDNSLMTIDPSYSTTPGVTNIVASLTTGNNIVNGMAFGQFSCCAIDTNYVEPEDTITINTSWSDKIVIPDNTIIVVDNAELDITNVDIKFGQCSGIDFINGASLRANNSVFRPCNLYDTWRGIRFESPDSLMNQINESTFKNAEIALLFQNNTNAQINSNTFSNCNEAIVLDESTFTESIFGNNFVTNNSFPEYANCYQTTSPTDVIHIHGVGLPNGIIPNEMVINQNSFVMSNMNGTINTTAVDLLNSQASISENTITNIQTAIIIDDPSGATFIEGNEIENNYLFQTVTPASSQIGVFNTSGVAVRIDNNELRNSILSDQFNSIAIQVGRSNNVSISNNSIEGFNIGISGRLTTKFNISENNLNSIQDAGISMDENNMQGTNFITCNDITMIMNSGTSIVTFGCSPRTEITSNCLKDGREGIRTQGVGNIPLIRNNFIYNYNTGIRNIGHSGTIGTSTDPGMNTLWSNNNSSLDISSSTFISVGNNFGMFNITSGTVSITANNPIHSTASCGHQIFNMPSQGSLNTVYTCDNESQFIQPMVEVNGEKILPNSTDLIEYLSGRTNEVEVMTKLIQLDGCTEAYIQEVLSATNINSEDEAFVWYSYHKHNNEFLNASAKLTELSTSNYAAFAEIEKLVLKRLKGETLDANDFASIDTYLQNSELNESLYNLAVSLSKTGPSHGTYIFKSDALIYDDQSTFNGQINEDVTTLNIFPNPTTDEINIQVLEGKMIAGQRLVIYDMYGNKVKVTPLDFVSGIEKVNVSALASGSYFVVLVSDESRSERTKFIKL